MCGASSQQKEMYSAQSAFYREMTAQYTQVFGKQQAILDTLTSTFMPILKAGPGQRGFTDAERTILETQATEGVAQNFDKAQQTLNENLAARGGSDFIPSGADTQLEEGLASVAASTKSNLDQQITQADFAEGRRQWQAAAGVLGGVASEMNPVGFANAATNAGSAASDTANDIAAASNSIWGSVIGGLSGIAGQAVGGWANRQGGQQKGANG